MGVETRISWAHHTKSPWEGCCHVHTGCDNCYAEARNMRWKHGAYWGPKAVRRVTPAASMKELNKWHLAAYKNWEYARTFPSLCDPFEDFQGNMVNGKGKVLDETMDDVRHRFFEQLEKTWALFHILLTKRPENVHAMIPFRWHDNPPANVMVCVSASDQDTLREMAVALPEWPGHKGICLEPLVGDVKIPKYILKMIDWVIVGCESGPAARPGDVENVASIVDRCSVHGVPCYVKQLGARPYLAREAPRHIWPAGTVYKDDPDDWRHWYDLRHPKGGDPMEWPKQLREQKFPKFMTGPLVVPPQEEV